MADERFSDFIAGVWNSCNFDAYLVLDFIPGRLRPISDEQRFWEALWAETDPAQHHWTKTLTSADECFERWLEEIQMRPPAGAGVRHYFWLRERRTGGCVRFHVLIADWQGDDYTWLPRWNSISGGWAFQREISDRTPGLLGYLVIKCGCSLELNCAGFPARLYTAADFRPWNTTRY